MKLNLYIDFDGVILNTIDVASDMYFGNKKHIGYPSRDFYESIDWEKLIDNCHEINNSLTNLSKIIKSNLYNVKILTHIVCNKEKEAKTKYLKRIFPDLEVITVFKDYNKCDVVDCKGAILVDDYTKNLDLWESNGGISIKFSHKKKKYNYITISNLNSLLDIFPKLKALSSKKTC
ncbi:MAG: hypothetical protein IKF19_03095 [Bacilli bacterium]|nr:hypothetical protein [Bacilli bacterium]